MSRRPSTETALSQYISLERMTVSVFSRGRDRPRFTAWEPVQTLRKMDLSWAQVTSRESNAKFFREGWDERLMSAGYLISIQHPLLSRGVVWMIDCNGAARYLGCTPKSLCKNIETMRYFRRISGEGILDILREFGFILRENLRHMEMAILDSPRPISVACAFVPPPLVMPSPPLVAQAPLAFAQVQAPTVVHKAQVPIHAAQTDTRDMITAVPCSPLPAAPSTAAPYCAQCEPAPPQVEYFTDDDIVVGSPMDVFDECDRMAVTDDSCFELPMLSPSYCEEMWSF